MSGSSNQQRTESASFNLALVGGTAGDYIWDFYVSYGFTDAESVWNAASRSTGGTNPTVEALDEASRTYLNDQNRKIARQDLLLDSCEISYEPESAYEADEE